MMFHLTKSSTTVRLLLFFLLFSWACAAQSGNGPRPITNAGAPSYPLRKVTCSGSKRFAEADIVKASGLKTGNLVTADDLQQAADRLGRSGAFAQVNYRFSGDTAYYTVADAQQFLPATYENFIWFANADLVQRVHTVVPLFNGSVPLAGTLVDQVSAALDLILKEKGMPGHTTSMLQGKLAGAMQSMQFQIEGMDAKIGEIRFPGATPEHSAQLQKVIKLLAGENYLQSFFRDVVTQNAPQVYGKIGFLKAKFGDAKPVILKDDPAQPVVAVEVPVEEGGQFTFLAANWTGVNAIALADLAQTVELKPGAVADTTQIGLTIMKAKELYGTKGYMLAQVRSTTTLDDEKHAATFNLDVKEGPLYHMGKLEVQAPDPGRAELVRKLWEIHEGDVYDTSYIKNFMRRHPAEMAALNGWVLHFAQTTHDDTHTVDVAVKFAKKEAK